nr:hypothetical protein [Pseudomonas sp. BMS12]
MRLDDNGNRFVVRTALGRQAAERLARKYQARGHKQSYWACRTADAGTHPARE